MKPYLFLTLSHFTVPKTFVFDDLLVRSGGGCQCEVLGVQGAGFGVHSGCGASDWGSCSSCGSALGVMVTRLVGDGGAAQGSLGSILALSSHYQLNSFLVLSFEVLSYHFILTIS